MNHNHTHGAGGKPTIIKNMQDNIAVAEINLTSLSSSSSLITSSNYDDRRAMKNEKMDDGALVERRDEHKEKNDNEMMNLGRRSKHEKKLAAVDAIFAAGTSLLEYACLRFL
jgi:hypothetical protein